MSKGGGFSVKSEKKTSTEVLYAFDAGQTENDTVVVGIDEAGRGPLAGPVVAAAVVLDHSAPIDGINDSKKLSAGKRDRLFEEIISRSVGWASGSASVREIDRVNILQATFLAMWRAVCSLKVKWNVLLVDGNRMIPQFSSGCQRTVVGGDAVSASIAAASICAKVIRDRIMSECQEDYPQYCFGKHKGYGTAFHRRCIQQYGLSPLHRRTFCSHLLMQTTLDL